jgi:phosphatidylglycerol:prolipoprotein diacylglycerol transferase
MAPVLAAIPYTTFPTIDLGFVSLRTFGLVVAIGVLIGAWCAARYGEEHRIPRDTTYSLAMRMVVAGVIGSRITWALTHTDELSSPWEAFAIWQGGLQFSGGFVFAVIAGYPVYRHWNRLTRWHSLDGYAYGLAIGLGIGRIGATRWASTSGARRASRSPSGTTAVPCGRQRWARRTSSPGWCSTRRPSTS